MTEAEKLKIYTSIVPNERQLIVQDMKFYAFIHYTVNTFTNREWGNGKESEQVFNPKCQDVTQWVREIKNAGMKGLVLTCKHHDGFCLWDTKTTTHNVMNSPYGKDVVKEVSEACTKYGIKFGVYLSPWDRNSVYYAKGEAYNDFYIAQLTELLTNYGEIFMLWLDGACGDSVNGMPPQKYDFERIWSTALALQPKICLSGCAPDVRWVGNESGVSRKSEWNVIPAFSFVEQKFATECQDTSNMKKFQKQCIDHMARDLGSRKFLADYDEFMWYPAEVDVSIRKGWFNHGVLDFTTKSLKHLMKIYYKAVGGNSLLILNIPPDKKGLISPRDVKRLRQLGDELRKEQSLKLLTVDSFDYVQTDKGYEININFEKSNIDRIRLEENTLFSQRIESFEVYALLGDNSLKLLSKETIIGYGKYVFFKPIITDNIRIIITSCRLEPHLKLCEIYKTGAYRI